MAERQRAPLPGTQLRIAVLGNFESLHTQRYTSFFGQRGHEVHAISYYQPRVELPRVTQHVLSGRTSGAESSRGKSTSTVARFARGAPPSLLRLVQAFRYQRAGLTRVLSQIDPDVFHAHYVVEHGFYGSFTGTHPYVVTAWGSDLLRDSYTLFGRLIAGFALGRADLVTGNDPSLLRRAVALGVPAERTALVRVGIDRQFLEARSINLKPDDTLPPTVISDRALEPLYNVGAVVRAFAIVRRHLPEAFLVIANDGSQRGPLESLARDLGLSEAVRFTGRLGPAVLGDALASAHVYVSVPGTDSMAVSNLEAMAAGAFPVLSHLPSVGDWITPGVNGLLVPPTPGHQALGEALLDALADAPRRRDAALANRARVEAEGMHEDNMLLLERLYYRLAGHPVSDERVI